MFGATVVIPPHVRRELLSKPESETQEIERALERRIEVHDVPSLGTTAEEVVGRLDPGEREAVGLAAALPEEALLIIDDQAGRRAARQVVEALRGIGVRKIILFGSRVWGEPRPDSDLDILVVLNEPGVPDTSAEKGALYRRVSTPLRDLQRKWPLDLIVHSLGMHRRFQKRKSAFARKVLDEGEVVYENGS